MKATGVITLLLVGLISLPAVAAEQSDYSVADLLKPCEEGDNDARWGESLEAQCEQFINGFAGAYLLLTDDGKKGGICLPPPGNRPDEMRWAFVEWTYENFKKRHIPAAEGLLAAIKSRFSCG